MTIHCTQIVNNWLKSNTYILSTDTHEGVWLVDCGDYAKVAEWLRVNEKHLSGILLTHGHHDHIYGIPDALEHNPHIPIYISSIEGRKFMEDPKLNMSRYTDTIVSVNYEGTYEVNNDDTIQLWEDVKARVMLTPGHTPDCVSYIIDNYLFTGDAYIPKVVLTARSKGGNREEAIKSAERIINWIKSHPCSICAGHHAIIQSEEIIKEGLCTIHIH